MSVRWESPDVGRRRRSGGSVDECEMLMRPDAATAVGDDGDHSRSRNGSASGRQAEHADRIASGGRCPVARVDVELSDEEDPVPGRDDTDEIVVLDEASERLLGKWNGNAKVKMFKSKTTSPNEPSPPPGQSEQDCSGMHITLNPSSRATSPSAMLGKASATPSPTPSATHPLGHPNPLKSINNNNSSNSNNKASSKPCGKGGGNAGDGGGSKGAKKRKSSDEESDIIGELIGDYGKWQFVMTFLLSLFQVPNTFHIYSPTFQAADKSFWCRRPTHLDDVPIDRWRNVSSSVENCRMLNYDWNALTSAQLSMSNFSLPKNVTDTVACSAWEFDVHDNLGNTWSSEWNLVCDKEYLKNVAEMFFLAGVATGGITSGVLSDKFGRKMMLFISAVLQSIFGLALYFADSFEFYLVLRALLGIVSVSVTYAGLILAIEYVDGKWRTIAGMYNLFPLPVSYIMISGIAYLTQDYRNLQLCIGLPGVFLCLLWFVLPESPRWLLCKGRITEVKEVIRKAAAFNKRPLPDNLDKLLKPPVDEEETAAGVCELFRSKYLRLVTFCFLCIWFTMNLVYYGLVLNMNSFGGNIYLNSALAGLVEIPAIALAMYIINRTGKKWLFCATFFAAALACLCAAIVEGKPELLAMKITFVMIGKFTISAGNTIMPVYTAELYPTAIRNVGVGACNLAAGFALVLTPYLSLLTKIEVHLLMTLLTAWCIFGAIVIIFLPEAMQHHEHEEHDEDKEIDTQVPA
uniref:Major facilitator superfamily (MFS) profile domain-containing protein n=2 Tax=Anopheles coluzzii TaxID=1518534 RepID=A0A6E8W8V5_ANOCL|nr:organic cation transporter protein isoform X1 [Anopheles coluzzii]XP_040220540.2 organic cation transporter protein isoform X1 [Anopheles coluzzii]XP_040220541.2 organic cation transporter protein isoform X1 [Anopheles coluzzii]XP_040220542.2 organic cation transporter protein isoform X1 [Anopheles coluzzii]XP_049462818.1 organic cation transporter protein isoform X1 [Anopheles coluzzii]XP_049462819.1 organic cation transporter protein isoform X1 [Anopheles coluzzii]